MSTEKPSYNGPMSQPSPKLDREEIFGKIPEARPELAEFFDKKKGWEGFTTPYSDVLRPLFFHMEREKNTDLTLVDFGCGWGEHAVLAGIGYPGGDIPKVERSIGLGVDAREIQTAKLISRLAQVRPSYFQTVMQNADLGANLGFESPMIENLRKVLSLDETRDELNEVLDSSSNTRLTEFIKRNISDYVGFERKSSDSPDENIHFIETNIFHPPLPDNFADRIICSSVSSYIKDPVKEEGLWKSVLRIIKNNGVINAISFEYERDGKLTSAPEQLQKVAQTLGIDLEVVQKRDRKLGQDIEHWRRQTIFKVLKK